MHWWIEMKRCSNMCSSCVWINYCRLRSKIWWFTNCRSHYVSHFAAFFIVARTKISVVKSRICMVFVVLQSLLVSCNGVKDCIQLIVWWWWCCRLLIKVWFTFYATNPHLASTAKTHLWIPNPATRKSRTNDKLYKSGEILKSRNLPKIKV